MFIILNKIIEKNFVLLKKYEVNLLWKFYISYIFEENFLVLIILIIIVFRD